MSQRFTIVRFLLGGLLLAAAALKLYGLSVSAIPRVGWFSQPWVQMAAVEWELVLGLWLFSGAQPRGAWLAALITFATFAVISGYQSLNGVASCGCFGVIEASPWWAFGIDVAILTVLLIVVGRKIHSPPATLQVDEPSRLSPAISGVLIAAVLALLLVTAVGSWMYGSPAKALTRLKGAPAYVPEYVDFGTGRSGTAILRDITVTNWRDEPIRLVGGTADCSCIVTTNLPVVVDPKGSAVVVVRLKIPPSETGAFTREAELWVDDGASVHRLRFTVGCSIE